MYVSSKHKGHRAVVQFKERKGVPFEAVLPPGVCPILRACSEERNNCMNHTWAGNLPINFQPNWLQEQLTLEPYHRDHALVVGIYRASKKKKEE